MAYKAKPLDKQYRDIVAARGYDWDACKVMSFVLRDGRCPEKLHYALMLSQPRPEYILFDCYDDKAIIIVNKERVEDIERISALARQFTK